MSQSSSEAHGLLEGDSVEPEADPVESEPGDQFKQADLAEGDEEFSMSVLSNGRGMDEDLVTVRFRKTNGEEGSHAVQVRVDQEEREKDLLEQSDGDTTDQESGDHKTLLSSEEEIDSEGVVREYEVALKYLGFGLFHILLLLVSGTALLSDAIEILSISFVLPVLSHPDEFGAGDLEEAVLSSIIFVGMLFGSYVWGGLADVIGRRTTIVISLSLGAVFGFVSAFSPWFWLFVVLRFLSGFG